MTEGEMEELVKTARRLGYNTNEQIRLRLRRMIERNQAYLESRARRGIHRSHDDVTAEDMAVIALVIELLA